jgi:replicative DNA helicase
MSAELNVGIVTIAHENDDGQIRDCRTIGKRASVVVKLERDKMSEDDDDRNTTRLLVTKNRPAGTTGHAGSLTFDGDSFTLKEKFDRFA